MAPFRFNPFTGTFDVVNAAGGSGDITSVGDVSSGAAFDGTQGTTLTFNNAGGDMTLAYDGSVMASSKDVTVPDEAYGSGWNGSLEVPTKNAVYDKIETITKSPREFWWTASALEPLEAADSIPPISKFTGTNIDILVCSFDDSTDEGRKVSFKVPSDVGTGNVTYRVVWFSRTATTGNVIWDARSTATGAEGESWDGSITTDSAAADAVQGTTNQMTVTTWTETVSNLGWAANDVITVMLYRDANNASDTLVGDAEVVGFGIEIPRA